jgi:hypothetical protein
MQYAAERRHLSTLIIVWTIERAAESPPVVQRTAFCAGNMRKGYATFLAYLNTKNEKEIKI